MCVRIVSRVYFCYVRIVSHVRFYKILYVKSNNDKFGSNDNFFLMISFSYCGHK